MEDKNKQANCTQR